MSISQESHIKLHRHKEKVFSVRTSLYCGEILDRLPKLLEKSKVDLGYGFWIELGVSSENYVFVARENTSREDPHCMFDVFALKVQDGGKMRLDEVFNTARSTFACAFGSEEKGNLTVYYYPNSRSADDDQGYPCGTIFTIGPADHGSNSSQDSNQPIRYSPRLLQNTYTPDCDYFLNSPTPAENSDQYEDCSTRKGKVQEASLALQEEPHKLSLFAKTVGYTGPQPVIQVASDDTPGSDAIGQNVPGVGIEDPAEDVGVVISPAEESFTSAENSSLSSEGQIAPKLGSEIRNSDAIMVTGRLSSRPEVRPDGALAVTQVPVRRLSLQVNPVINLPIPEGNRLALQRRVRAYSDVDKVKYPRTISDPEGKFCPVAVNVDSEAKHCPSNIGHQENTKLNAAELARPVLLRSTSGPPTTPVLDTQRPLLSNIQPPTGVERQESRGEDEFVVGLGKVQPQISGPNIAVVVSDTTEVKELQGSLGGLNLVGSGDVPAIRVSEGQEGCAEAVVPFGAHSEMCESVVERLGVSEGRGSKDRRSSTGGDGSFSETLSDTDLYQVHLLGHACNKRCNSKMGCPHVSDPGFAEGVKQMASLVRNLFEVNESTEDLKRYIYIHCYRDCPGVGCQVPHLAAGCGPPSEPHIAPDHTPSPSLRGLTGCSMDEERAFDSTKFPDPAPEGEQAVLPREQMKLPLDGNYPLTRFMHGSATPTPIRGMPAQEKRFHGTRSPMFSKGGTTTPYMDGRMFGTAVHHQFVDSPLCADPLSQLPTPGQSPNHHWYTGVGTPNHQGHPRQVLGTPNHQGQGLWTPNHQGHPRQVLGMPNHQGQGSNHEGHPHQGTPNCQGHPHQAPGSPNYQELPTPGYPEQALPTPGQSPNHQGYPQLPPRHHWQESPCPEGNRERAYQFQKYDPQTIARIRKLHEDGSKGRQQLPDVGKEGFPECRAYKGIELWTVIYSAQDCQDVLMPGFTLPRPHMDREKVGRGGNGKVSRHYVNQKLFAIKETNYRQGELNAWRKLSHPNLVPLLGVMLGQNNQTCYQFMPYMSQNLSEVIHKVGCLEKLSKSADWKVVKSNMWCHVLIPVLQGLQHLESLNMQHCDVKASNILISKPDTCFCQDILHCTCPEDMKFQVMLADYDSIKETQHCRVAQNIPHVECSYKSPEQLKKVMGTIAYRPPEKFVMPCKSPSPSAEATPHDHTPSSASYLEGPWCDMWSFGMVVTRLAMGRDTDADKRNANILKDQPHRKDLTANTETIHAIIKLKGLHQAASSDINLKPFADLADSCLVADFRQRLTPGQLLDVMRSS